MQPCISAAYMLILILILLTLSSLSRMSVLNPEKPVTWRALRPGNYRYASRS